MSDTESIEEELAVTDPLLLDDDSDPITLAEICMYCRLGHHDECEQFWLAASTAVELDGPVVWDDCCCGGDINLTSTVKRVDGEASLTSAGGYVPGPRGGIPKDPNKLKDALSTGRKAAAKAAPIEAGMTCEWAWLAAAGGGVVPIIGCPGRPASDRHHGPDKNTLNNELGVNLHRICDWCHNQWHAKNDPFYGPRALREDGLVDAAVPFVPLPGLPNLPHDPIRRASDEEVYAEDAIRREAARKHGAKI